MKTSSLTNVFLGLTVVLQLILFGVVLRQPAGGGQPTNQRPALLPARDAPADTFLDLSGLPMQGDKKANIFLVEFSDFECPFCRRHATEVLSQLRERFIATGKIQYAFVNNPLQMHRNAKLLAGAAICAGRQGRYWDAHSYLFEKAPRSRDAVLTLAADAKLDITIYSTCLDDKNKEWSSQLEKDMAEAQALGLTATPAFVLGRRVDGRGGDMIQLQKMLTGAQPLEAFSKAIDEVK